MDSPPDRDKKGTAVAPDLTTETAIAQAAVLVDQLRELFKTKGIDLDQRLTEYAKRQLPQSRADFDELCSAECDPAVLGFIIGLTKRAPRLQSFWSTFAGKRESRRKPINALTKAAETLDDLWLRSVLAFVSADLREEDIRGRTEVDLTEDQIAQAGLSAQQALSAGGHISPAQLASELRYFASMLTLSDFLIDLTKSRSPKHFARYILSAYVYRATGRFHDRSVASILADLTHSNCTADDQRVWRDRYYDGFESRFSAILDRLIVREKAPDAT